MQSAARGRVKIPSALARRIAHENGEAGAKFPDVSGCHDGVRRIAILISGRGSNMPVTDRRPRAQPIFPAEIALVMSNRPEAGGLALARAGRNRGA